MAVIRTSLSLIGFGFTIYQIFKKLYEANVLRSGGAARNFGGFPVSMTLIVALVLLGIGIASVVAILGGGGPLS